MVVRVRVPLAAHSFSPLTMMKNNTEWSENVILADADYMDGVAFNLTVNFERMLGRRVPPADTALWAECVALDGGVTPSNLPNGEKGVQVVLIHEREHTSLKNFEPGNYTEELDGKAVQSRVGELVFNAVQTMYDLDEEVAYSTKASYEGFVENGGMECCECGCCSFICPAKRPLTQSIKSMRKIELANRRKK